MAPSADDHHLLSRYRKLEREAEQARILAREVRRAFDEGKDVTLSPAARDAVDGVRLRGIPAIGRGTAGGEIRGTRPDRAILNLDRRR